MKPAWLAALAGGLIAAGACVYADAPARRLPLGTRADRIVVRKAGRTLSLYRDGTLLKSFRVSLGRNPVGAKERQGDDRTPEGRYRVDYRLRDSRYHLALHVSYPSRAEKERAARLGFDPGGDIMIHGLPNGLGFLGRWHLLFDWTRGCVAVTNPDIREIWRVVPDGTDVEILP